MISKEIRKYTRIVGVKSKNAELSVWRDTKTWDRRPQAGCAAPHNSLRWRCDTTRCRTAKPWERCGTIRPQCGIVCANGPAHSLCAKQPDTYFCKFFKSMYITVKTLKIKYIFKYFSEVVMPNFLMW